jgi:hypothetical protein
LADLYHPEKVEFQDRRRFRLLAWPMYRIRDEVAAGCPADGGSDWRLV